MSLFCHQLQGKSCKKKKQKQKKQKTHMEAKQYATKQLVDHWRDKKIPKNKWKQKQIFPK